MSHAKQLHRAAFILGLTCVGVMMCATAFAQSKAFDKGATDKEITIGNVFSYTGPASAYGTAGRAFVAYFDKVNAEGGINGRKVRIVTLDDGQMPANTLSQTRRLVEGDGVFGIFALLGTPPNLAVRKYLNDRKIPHLFGLTPQTALGNYQEYPFTMGWPPTYQHEAAVYAKHLLNTKPNAKIAVLHQSGDYGNDFLAGLAKAFGDRWSKMLVAKASYELTDPTIDTQIVSLAASGADTLFIVASSRWAAQALRKTAELGWKPTHYINAIGNSVTAVMKPSGVGSGAEYISSFYMREPDDPEWTNTREHQEWLAWMKKYYPGGDVHDNLNVMAYSMAQTLEKVLTQMSDDLTRANMVKQAANLDFVLPMLLPGIRIKTSPTDYFPIQQLQLGRWDGTSWKRFGGIESAE